MRESISGKEFDWIAFRRVEGERKITGVYDVNLDAREFSAARPELAWITCRLKDISAASWHSYRTGSYDRERRQSRLMEKLAGRSARLLRKMDAYCQEQTGQTLKGYSALRLAEDMAPLEQPAM